MIESDHNFYYEYENKFILYNSNTGELINFHANDKNEIYKQLSNPDKKSSFFNVLHSGGFIVNDVCGEYDKDYDLNNPQKRLLKLIILPTEQCNFRCRYCYEAFLKGKMSTLHQLKLINYVEHNIEKYRGLEVVWFGGEPLIAMDVIENLSSNFINICSRQSKIYVSSVVTNGYHLTLDILKRLKKCNVTTYQITLDGLKNTHDSQRVISNGKGSYDTIIDNLINISKNTKSSMLNIIIRTNLTIDIMNNLKEYQQFLKETFGFDKRFSFLWRIAGDWNNIQDETIKDRFIGADDYLYCLKEAAKLGLQNKVLLNMFKPKGMVCYASDIDSLVIGSDGCIHKCTCDLDNKYNNIGSVDNFILNDNYIEWVKDMDFTKCRKCKMKSVCQSKACVLNRNVTQQPECPIDIQLMDKIIPEVLSFEKHILY